MKASRAFKQLPNREQMDRKRRESVAKVETLKSKAADRFVETATNHGIKVSVKGVEVKPGQTVVPGYNTSVLEELKKRLDP